jgi:hypothetical protein
VLDGSPDAEFAVAVVVMVAMEDYGENEGSREKAAWLDAHLTRVHTLPVLGPPDPNMMRPEARVTAVPQVTGMTRRNGSAMQMIQEEAVYFDARDRVGQDVYSDLYCLSAKARPDGESKGRTLA